MLQEEEGWRPEWERKENEEFRKYAADWRKRMLDAGLMIPRKATLEYRPERLRRPFGEPVPKRTFLQWLLRKPPSPYKIEGLVNHDECEEPIDEIIHNRNFLGRIWLRMKKLWKRI